MIVLFLPFDYTINLAIHVPLAVAVLAFAFYIQREVRRTSCPERIKKITRTTWSLAIFQTVLGVALVIGTALSWGNLYATVISFLHVGNALASSGFVLGDILRYVGREGVSNRATLLTRDPPWLRIAKLPWG